MKVNQHRKFHDAWAFILWVIFIVVANTIVVLGTNPEDPYSRVVEAASRTLKFDPSTIAATVSQVLVALGVFTALFLGTTGIMFAGFIYFPKAFIYITLLGPIILSAITMILHLLVGVVSITLTGLLMFLIYIFIIRPHIDYIAKVLSRVATILSNYLGKILCLIFLTNVLNVIQQLVIVSKVEFIMSSFAVQIVLALYVFWTAAVNFYFFTVLAAGLIANHLCDESDGKKVFGRALRNTIIAMGTICLGALITAVLNTFSYYIQKKQDESIRRYDGVNRYNLPTLIFLGIADCCVNLCGALIREMNEMIYPYVAIHGTSYADSVSKSFHELVAKNCRAVAAKYATSSVIALCCILHVEATTLVYSLLRYLYPEFPPIIVFVPAVSYFVLFFGVCSMVPAAVLAYVYSHVEFPDALDKEDSDIVELIESVGLEDEPKAEVVEDIS